MQADGKGKAIIYSLFAFLQEAAGCDPRFTDSKEKAVTQSQRPDDFCAEIKDEWNRKEAGEKGGQLGS